jgi:hypothetical protein
MSNTASLRAGAIIFGGRRLPRAGACIFGTSRREHDMSDSRTMWLEASGRASGRSHHHGPLDWDLLADDVAAFLAQVS